MPLDGRRPTTGFVRPEPLTRSTNDGDEKESRAAEGPEGRAQSTPGQARRKEGGRRAWSSQGRGSPAGSPDRPEDRTPPRPEGCPGCAGPSSGKAVARRRVRRAVGRAAVRRAVVRKAVARRGVRKAVGRAKVRRAVKRTGVRRAVRKKSGHGRSRVGLAHVPVELSLFASK